jgi:molybdopterin molybdotransferase
VTTIDDARRIVLRAVRPLASEAVPIADALERVLARDVIAARDVPPFSNSAMDGFALVAGPAGRSLLVVG